MTLDGIAGQRLPGMQPRLLPETVAALLARLAAGVDMGRRACGLFGGEVLVGARHGQSDWPTGRLTRRSFPLCDLAADSRQAPTSGPAPPQSPRGQMCAPGANPGGWQEVAHVPLS